MERADKQEL